MAEISQVVRFLVVGVGTEQRRNRFHKEENKVAQSIPSYRTLAKPHIKGALTSAIHSSFNLLNARVSLQIYIASNERRGN